jgi:tetratricopeptide (TPR) repeat protein
MRGRLAEQLSATERALRHARSAGDDREQSLALFWIPDAVAWGPTPADEGARRCEALLREYRGRPSCEAGVKHALGMLYAMQGRDGESRAASSACRELYRELGLEMLWCTSVIGAAVAELILDEPAAAERELREAIEVLEGLGERAYRSTSAAVLAQALNEQGRHHEAVEATRLSEELASPDDMPSQIGWRSQRARALAQRGERVDAERLARAAVSLAESTDSPLDRGESAFALAEVLLAAGRRAEATQAAAAALRAWEHKGVVGRAGKARAILAGLEPPARG